MGAAIVLAHPELPKYFPVSLKKKINIISNISRSILYFDRL